MDSGLEQARLYVDSRCVWFGKPLLESGTWGPLELGASAYRGSGRRQISKWSCRGQATHGFMCAKAQADSVLWRLARPARRVDTLVHREGSYSKLQMDLEISRI